MSLSSATGIDWETLGEEEAREAMRKAPVLSEDSDSHVDTICLQWTSIQKAQAGPATHKTWKSGADAPSCFPPGPAVSPSAAAQSSASVPQLPLCSLLLEAWALRGKRKGIVTEKSTTNHFYAWGWLFKIPYTFSTLFQPMTQSSRPEDDGLFWTGDVFRVQRLYPETPKSVFCFPHSSMTGSTTCSFPGYILFKYKHIFIFCPPF